MNREITLRPARAGDTGGVCRASNQPFVRNASLHGSHVTRKEHDQLLDRVFGDSGWRLWVAEIDGLVVGPNRFGLQEGTGLATSVDRRFPPRGVGASPHRQAPLDLLGHNCVSTIVAQFKRGNLGCIMFFGRLRFVVSNEAQLCGEGEVTIVSLSSNGGSSR